MACPVLLTVALNKVGLNNTRSRPIGHAIYLAVSNLIISLFAFIVLVVVNLLKHWTDHESLLDFLYRSSKLLVHVSAILQSVLAYMIVLIKLNFQQSVPHLVLCILFSVFPALWWMPSVQTTHTQDNVLYTGFHDKLEQSLDILVSVTSFLFQILVAVSLESQASSGQDNSHDLRGTLVFTFVFCLFATCFLLVGAVLFPIQFDNDEQRKQKCDTLCKISVVLAGTLTIVLSVAIPLVTKLRIDIEWAVVAVVVPWISIIGVFVLSVCRMGTIEDDQATKPAPLGLTKAMFAVFLVLLIPSFRSETVSGSTKAFMVFTSGVVISGLLWRFATHFAPMKAALIAADAACLLTLLFLICAGIFFVLVAKDAFAQGTITCQTSCTSGQQIQDSVLDCIRNNMTEFQGKTWTAVLSSVPC